jgi:hypothetical protein
MRFLEIHPELMPTGAYDVSVRRRDGERSDEDR